MPQKIVSVSGSYDPVTQADPPPRVDLHERGASHFALLGAFARRELLERAYAHAEREGYLCHEFGDSSLILPEAA